MNGAMAELCPRITRAPIRNKLTTIGKSAGLIFPKEALSRLKLQKGDTLFLTETKEGYLLTPYNPEFEAQMKHAEDVMSRYRNTLKELAK